MAVQVEVHYNGKVYKGKIVEDATALEMKDGVYSVVEKMTKFEMELENGHYLILNETAIQNAAILILDA